MCNIHITFSGQSFSDGILSLSRSLSLTYTTVNLIIPELCNGADPSHGLKHGAVYVPLQNTIVKFMLEFNSDDALSLYNFNHTVWNRADSFGGKQVLVEFFSVCPGVVINAVPSNRWKPLSYKTSFFSLRHFDV
jgi:hypothetical protein